MQPQPSEIWHVKDNDSRVIASRVLEHKVKVPSTSVLPAITEPICFADKDRGEKPAVERLALPILYTRIYQSIFFLFAGWVRVNCAKTVFDRLMVDLRNFRHLELSRTFLTIACLILAGLIGYVDYLTGYERSLLLFYLLPISLAAWFGSFAFSIAIGAICVIAWVLSDLASGIPVLGFWNIGMASASYVLFAAVLSKLGTLVRQLDRRVKERTAALEREMAERRRLDQEIGRVADRERRRLGHDLHDTLGQHLTGTALAAQVLKEKLAARLASETAEAEKLVRCVEEGIDLTRNLARGFFSPELEAEGLVVALQNLAETVTERFGINCVLDGDELIPIHDSTVANQLYQIAQEAVTNSVKHAAAKHIDIRLAMDGPELCLSIVDDGVGFPDKPRPEGLGLHLMRHGAALSGGTFDVRRNGKTGTIATCRIKHLSSNDFDLTR